MNPYVETGKTPRACTVSGFESILAIRQEAVGLISCCRTFSVPDIQDVCFCLLYMHPVWIGVGAGIRVQKFIRYHAASAELLAVSRRGATNKLSFHKPTGKKNTTHTHHLPRVKCTCGVAQLSRIPMNAPCLDWSRFGHRTVKSKKRGPKGHALV